MTTRGGRRPGVVRHRNGDSYKSLGTWTWSKDASVTVSSVDVFEAIGDCANLSGHSLSLNGDDHDASS